MSKAAQRQIVSLARHAGVLRPRDLSPRKIPRQYLSLLEQSGKIRKVGRGLYVLPDADLGENQTIAEAAKRVPRGVLCLLSALRIHGLTTQAPFEVWLAVDRKAWKPHVDQPRLRIVRFSGKALTQGIERIKIKEINVPVYSPAKTIADCFKYRNKIGLDVALEALRECLRQKKASIDEIWRYARICRVANVMRPYMEALS